MFRFLLFIVFSTSPGPLLADGIDWSVIPDFRNDKAAMEISGAICPGEDHKKTWCYAINDEDNRIQIFKIQGRTIVPGKRIRILPKLDAGGDKIRESDLEAISYFDGNLYLTGSHGLSRKKDKFRPSQFLMFKLPIDKQTGEPKFDISGKYVAPEITQTNKLREIIKSTPQLANFAEKPLREKGVNIEGMGIADGSIFFGFRGPVLTEGAVILEVAIDRLFGTGAAVPVVHHLQLGIKYGIRDIAGLRDGFAILAGASTDGDHIPIIWNWVPGNQPKLLKVLQVDARSKAEALVILSEKKKKSRKIRALVLFDGKKNGAPLEFKILQK